MKVFLISLCLFIPRALAAEVVTLGTAEWPPYTSQALKHDGVASHVVTLAFASQGIEVKYVYLPMARSLDSSKHGLYDGTFMWVKMPERDEYFIYSALIFEGQDVFFHLKSRTQNWLDPEKIDSVRLGLLTGFAFRNIMGVGRVETVGSAKQNFGKIFRGRIDVYLADQAVGYMTLRKEFSEKMAAKVTHSFLGSPPAWYYLLLNRKRHRTSGLMRRFNRGLKKIRAEGVYEQLMRDLEDGVYESLASRKPKLL